MLYNNKRVVKISVTFQGVTTSRRLKNRCIIHNCDGYSVFFWVLSPTKYFQTITMTCLDQTRQPSLAGSRERGIGLRLSRLMLEKSIVIITYYIFVIIPSHGPHGVRVVAFPQRMQRYVARMTRTSWTRHVECEGVARRIRQSRNKIPIGKKVSDVSRRSRNNNRVLAPPT